MEAVTSLKEKLASLKASFPAGFEKRLEQSTKIVLQTHPEYRQQVNKALNIVPTPCNDNTAVSQWLDRELADWDDTVIYYAIISRMLDFPTYDALLF
jgi:hypothetical protein